MSDNTTSPRETAQQIAERLAELEKTCVNMAHCAESGTQYRAWLERAELVASLTADLAQARQEAERERTARVNTALLMAQQVAMAEQARDEAPCPNCGFTPTLAREQRAWKDEEPDVESAARTALLEAAEELEKRYRGMRPMLGEVIDWLTTRAGGPRT